MQDLIRRAFISLLLGHSVLIAHAIGGSSPNISLPLIFSMLLSFIYCGDEYLSGPKLASFVLSFQILGHFSMTSGNSETRMRYSHLIAGIISYKLITRFQEITDLFLALLLPKFYKFLSVPQSFRPILFTRYKSVFKSFFLQIILLRGPPTLAA